MRRENLKSDILQHVLETSGGSAVGHNLKYTS